MGLTRPRLALPELTNDIRVKIMQDSGSVEFRGMKFGIGRFMLSRLRSLTEPVPRAQCRSVPPELASGFG